MIQTFTQFGFSPKQGKSEQQTFPLENRASRAKNMFLGFGVESTIFGTMIYAKKPGEIGQGIILI